MSTDEKINNSFESNIAKLENIIKELQSGRLSLEQALDHYEKGMKMSKDCESQLRKAEARICSLTEEGGLNAAQKEEQPA